MDIRKKIIIYKFLLFQIINCYVAFILCRVKNYIFFPNFGASELNKI